MTRSNIRKRPKGWYLAKRRIMKRDHGQCQICGETEGELHLDHIVPKRLGGDESDANLQILCRSCNLAKGGTFFAAFCPPDSFLASDIPKNASVSHE